MEKSILFPSKMSKVKGACSIKSIRLWCLFLIWITIMALNMQEFWFGKRVLVTGGDGFVASHLIKTLLGAGAYVVATIRHVRPLHTLNLIRDKLEKEELRPDIEQCDLLNFFTLRQVCDRHQIDTIFHLAASAIVSDAANSPMSTIENNVMATLNLLEVARINNIPRVLIASSDKSYGDHANDTLESLPYREDYALRGLDIYSASKVCADMIAQTYTYQFKVPIIVVRSCNIYGPGDLNFSRLIPKTTMCLLEGKAPIINRGNENVLREYIYVEDVVRAYIFLMEKVKEYYGENNCNMPKNGKATYGWSAFNVGSYTARDLADISKCENIQSVNQIITTLRGKIKDIAPTIFEKPANFIEIPDQYLEASKMFSLGFKPKIGFTEGLNRAVAWYTDKHKDLIRMAARYMIK